MKVSFTSFRCSSQWLSISIRWKNPKGASNAISSFRIPSHQPIIAVSKPVKRDTKAQSLPSALRHRELLAPCPCGCFCFWGMVSDDMLAVFSPGRKSERWRSASWKYLWVPQVRGKIWEIIGVFERGRAGIGLRRYGSSRALVPLLN